MHHERALAAFPGLPPVHTNTCLIQTIGQIDCSLVYVAEASASKRLGTDVHEGNSEARARSVEGIESLHQFERKVRNGIRTLSRCSMNHSTPST